MALKGTGSGLVLLPFPALPRCLLCPPFPPCLPLPFPPAPACSPQSSCAPHRGSRPHCVPSQPSVGTARSLEPPEMLRAGMEQGAKAAGSVPAPTTFRVTSWAGSQSPVYVTSRAKVLLIRLGWSCGAVPGREGTPSSIRNSATGRKQGRFGAEGQPPAPAPEQQVWPVSGHVQQCPAGRVGECGHSCAKSAHRHPRSVDTVVPGVWGALLLDRGLTVGPTIALQGWD